MYDVLDYNPKPHPSNKNRLWASAECRLDIEPYLDHVPVPDPVLLSLEPQDALVAAGGERRPARDEVVVGHHLGPDESAREVGVDGAGRVHRGVAVVQRPGAHLVRAAREERQEPQQADFLCSKRCYGDGG